MTASGRATGTAAPVIAIDGPSGTGKGTLRTRLATELGWHMLDSGALYRAVAWRADRDGLDPNDSARVADVARRLDIAFVPDGGETGIAVLVDGVDVTDAVRGENCGKLASMVAAAEAVRAALLERQRACRRPPGLVADGRDMGTVVFPDAALKLFLTATPETRARRRYNQLKEKGIDVSLAQLFADIQARDTRDLERAAAPLRAAPDAVVLDTSDLTIDEVTVRVRALLAHRGIGHRP